MTKFVNLHNHTLYSHDSASKIDDIINCVKEYGQTAIAITDHGNLSGAIKFHTTCNKAGIKPIIGCELYICQPNFSAKDKVQSNRRLNHLVVLAKNYDGYKNLLKLATIGNYPEHYYYSMRIDEEILFAHSDGLIVINGHHSTSLFDILFFNNDGVSQCESIEEARSYLRPDYKDKFLEIASRYRSVFGDDFYIECQLFDTGDILQQASGHILRELASEFDFRAVGTGDAHYIKSKDAEAHKTFCAIKKNMKIDKMADIGYFNSGRYCILSDDMVTSCYPEDLILATKEIEDKIEHYEVKSRQKIPHIVLPDKTPLQEVKDLCENRLKELGLWNDTYIERLNYELEITEIGELEHYCLIVRDYIMWAKSNGIIVGGGRGSAAGSLISYLIGITTIDPIKYRLSFDRYFSRDRAEAKINPDIDVDFQATRRDEVVNYIRQKYGADKVCGAVTYNILQGKSAIKDVLRVWDVCDATEANKISDLITAKDKISDKLSEFKDRTGSESIIMYHLIEEPEALKEYVYLEDGELKGEYAHYFSLAIQLEGAIKSTSRHPSAYIISNSPIYESAPLSKDKDTDDLLCNYDMYSFELAGLLKFDLLAIKSLDGLKIVNDLLGELTFDQLLEITGNN